MADKKQSSRFFVGWGEVKVTRPDMKPCPFCGGQVLVRTRRINNKDVYFFMCKNEACGATMSFDNDEVNGYSRRLMRYHKEPITEIDHAPAFECFIKRAGE